jgi:hypothetical protein
VPRPALAKAAAAQPAPVSAGPKIGLVGSGGRRLPRDWDFAVARGILPAALKAKSAGQRY